MVPGADRPFPPGKLGGQSAILANILLENDAPQSRAAKHGIVVACACNCNIRHAELAVQGLAPRLMIDVGGEERCFEFIRNMICPHKKDSDECFDHRVGEVGTLLPQKDAQPE
jgi:hypothetical protein